jgi:hypothetical protein
MSGDARDFNNIETRAVINSFFLQGNSPKEIHAILKETLGKYAPHIPPSKTWWPSLNLVILSPVVLFVLDDPKQ